MTASLFKLLLVGSVSDPILWIIAPIVGWLVKGSFHQMLFLLAAAGAIWGGLRVAVYIARGETVTAEMGSVMVLICAGLMIGVGLTVYSLIKWRQSRN